MAAETAQANSSSWYDELSLAGKVLFWAAVSIFSGFLVPLFYGLFKLGEYVSNCCTQDAARQDAAQLVFAKHYRRHNAKKNIDLEQYRAQIHSLSEQFVILPLGTLSERDVSVVYSAMANEARDDAKSFQLQTGYHSEVPKGASAEDAVFLSNLIAHGFERANSSTAANKRARQNAAQVATMTVWLYVQHRFATIDALPTSHVVFNRDGQYVGMLDTWCEDTQRTREKYQLAENILPDDAKLFSNFVVSKHRGQGVSKLMLDYCAAKTKRPLRGYVATTNTNNQRALAKAGFRCVTERPLPAEPRRMTRHVYGLR